MRKLSELLMTSGGIATLFLSVWLISDLNASIVSLVSHVKDAALIFGVSLTLLSVIELKKIMNKWAKE